LPIIKISKIKNKYDGGDWDEITEARKIALMAVSEYLNMDTLSRYEGGTNRLFVVEE